MKTLSSHLTDLGGGLQVRRLLPAAQQRSVGPFVFFDHFGPLIQRAGGAYDVRPHPHIGLATVTYLLDGAMMHRDSLGSVQRIEPGAINWMRAGRGIVHSERTPDDLRHIDRPLHGLQLWVALPREQEQGDPAFLHAEASALPTIDVDDAQVRVLLGRALGATSPVATGFDVLYLDIALPAGGAITLPPLAAEMAVYALDDALRADNQPLAAHTLTLCAPGQPLQLEADHASRCVVIGGPPLDGPRLLWWNFVATDKALISAAAERWDANGFDPVPGDTERIPLPPRRPT